MSPIPAPSSLVPARRRHGSRPASGLYYYGYRYLDTQLGRWLSRDPIAEYGGSNLYSFISNSAPTWLDLLGLNEDCKTPKFKDDLGNEFADLNAALIVAMLKAIANTWDPKKRGKNKERLEFCGRICCESGSNRIYYTGPCAGFHASCSAKWLAPCLDDDVTIGSYHSHPDSSHFSSAGNTAEGGSRGDREIARDLVKNQNGPLGLVIVAKRGTGGGMTSESEIQIWITEGHPSTDKKIHTVIVPISGYPWSDLIDPSWKKKIEEEESRKIKEEERRLKRDERKRRRE